MENKMDNLLKEAIADAKAVRETALENAKMALEEAFTPKIQSMLSKKIQMEMDDEDKVDEAESDEDEVDEAEEDEVEERAKMARDGDELEERGDEDEVNEEDDEDVEEGIIEIDGVKYAPVVSEEEEDEVEEEMDDEKMEEDEDEDLDLEAVIKELESEINEEDEEELDENDVSSDIGKSDNKVNAKANDSSNVGNDGKAKLKEEDEKEDMDEDDDIDLDEVLKALSEEEDEEKEMDEVSELKSNLAEHRSVIEELRGKLNEVNLLNAKLLFTNKLFRKYGLNNDQKMKVVEQFDRASNLREVKLVYSTLGESFGSARKNEINESKGSASKPVASTKSEKEVITEGSELRDRFKKLANLI